MTDMRARTEHDLLAAIAQRATTLEGCGRWAHVLMDTDGDREPLLYPKDRGAVPTGPAYRVTPKVVQRGLWRISLCLESELPSGVTFAAREQLLRAQYTSASMPAISPGVADQVVQCGLFGEVLYR